MPPSSTAPLREPASSRTAEWPSFCQGEASWARASAASEDSKQGCGKAERGAQGNHDDHRRLYRLKREGKPLNCL